MTVVVICTHFDIDHVGHHEHFINAEQHACGRQQTAVREMMQATAAAGEAAIKEVFEEQATKPRLHPRIGLRAEYRVLERWSSGAAGSSSFTDDSSQ